MMNINLSIVVPALEEETLISSSLNSLADYIIDNSKDLGSVEVVVVTAESKDKTIQIVEDHGGKFKYFQHIKPGPRVGKGRDVKCGILASRGKYVLFMDADLATPLHHIKEALMQMEEDKADILIGSRELIKIHTGARKIVSILANKVSSIIIGPEISDSQCGFKLFKQSAAKSIFKDLTINGWSFDIEVIAIARSRGYNIVQLPIKDWSENKADEMQLSGENAIWAALKSFSMSLVILKNKLLRKYQ